MFSLSFPEDCLHNNFFLSIVDLKFANLFLISGFVFDLAIAEEESSQLNALFSIVVRRDLVQPETHSLRVVFFNLRGFDVLARFLLELEHHLVLVLAPLRSELRSAWIFLIAITIVIGVLSASASVKLRVVCIPVWLFATTIPTAVWLSRVSVATSTSGVAAPILCALFIGASLLDVSTQLRESLWLAGLPLCSGEVEWNYSWKIFTCELLGKAHKLPQQIFA